MIIEHEEEKKEKKKSMYRPGVGRASCYEPWMCDKIIQIAKKGGHIAAMCAAIGVRSESTFHLWRRDNPEFAEACACAEMHSKVFYEDLLLKCATGANKDINIRALERILSAKFRDEYRESSQNNTEITINNLNLTPDQLTAKIAQKMAVLKSAGVALQGLLPITKHTDEVDDA